MCDRGHVERTPDEGFGQHLTKLMERRGVSVRALARRIAPSDDADAVDNADRQIRRWRNKPGAQSMRYLVILADTAARNGHP